MRRLVADVELVRRRAAGETLRVLAADYGVAHTTLGRYFARPEVVRQLREAGQGERRAAATRRVAERRAERAIRRQAKEQTALARDLRSRNDELAERAVEAGGGIEAVIEATGLRTRENVLGAIDPTILVHAFDSARGEVVLPFHCASASFAGLLARHPGMTGQWPAGAVTEARATPVPVPAQQPRRAAT